MNNLKISMSALLDHSKLIVTVMTKDKTIREALVNAAFDDETFDAFKKIFQKAWDLFIKHSAAVGTQKEKRILFEDYKTKTRRVYIKTRDTARAAFRDDPSITALLGLKGNSAKNFPLWVPGAKTLYKQMLDNENVTTKMIPLGIKPETLENEINMLTELEQFRQDYEVGAGTTKTLQADRNQAIRQLEISFSALKAILIVALDDEPEHLIKMKIKPGNPGRPRKIVPRERKV